MIKPQRVHISIKKYKLNKNYLLFTYEEAVSSQIRLLGNILLFVTWPHAYTLVFVIYVFIYDIYI